MQFKVWVRFLLIFFSLGSVSFAKVPPSLERAAIEKCDAIKESIETDSHQMRIFRKIANELKKDLSKINPPLSKEETARAVRVLTRLGGIASQSLQGDIDIEWAIELESLLKSKLSFKEAKNCVTKLNQVIDSVKADLDQTHSENCNRNTQTESNSSREHHEAQRHDGDEIKAFTLEALKLKKFEKFSKQVNLNGRSVPLSVKMRKDDKLSFYIKHPASIRPCFRLTLNLKDPGNNLGFEQSGEVELIFPNKVIEEKSCKESFKINGNDLMDLVESIALTAKVKYLTLDDESRLSCNAQNEKSKASLKNSPYVYKREYLVWL